MNILNRAAVIVTPKQPCIDWMNSFEGIKYDPELMPEKTVYLIDDVADYEWDIRAFVKPYYKQIFEQELEGWHLIEDDWPSKRTLEVFFEWFEVEVHSMVLDMAKERIRSDPF